MPVQFTISRWFDEGVAVKATHLFIVYDAKADVYFSEKVAGDEAALQAYARLTAKKDHFVMKIFNLAEDKDAQMSEHRPWRLPVAKDAA